jgi:hypothetical protein
MAQREVVLDERRRTSLAKVGRKGDARYLVEEFPDGTLVLTPAVTISAAEFAALGDPELRAAFDQAADLKGVKLRRRGSFRQYALDESGAGDKAS